jgi:hypothetical protein
MASFWCIPENKCKTRAYRLGCACLYVRPWQFGESLYEFLFMVYLWTVSEAQTM